MVIYIYLYLYFYIFEYKMRSKTNIFNTMPINARLCNKKINIKPTF